MLKTQRRSVWQTLHITPHPSIQIPIDKFPRANSPHVKVTDKQAKARMKGNKIDKSYWNARLLPIYASRKRRYILQGQMKTCFIYLWRYTSQAKSVLQCFSMRTDWWMADIHEFLILHPGINYRWGHCGFQRFQWPHQIGWWLLPTIWFGCCRLAPYILFDKALSKESYQRSRFAFLTNPQAQWYCQRKISQCSLNVWGEAIHVWLYSKTHRFSSNKQVPMQKIFFPYCSFA